MKIIYSAGYKGFIETLVSAMERCPLAFLESVRDCLSDMTDIGIASCFRSWASVFFVLSMMLPKVHCTLSNCGTY